MCSSDLIVKVGCVQAAAAGCHLVAGEGIRQHARVGHAGIPVRRAGAGAGVDSIAAGSKKGEERVGR